MSKYIKVDDVHDYLLSVANEFEKNAQYYPEKHLKEKAKTLRMLSKKFYNYPSNVEVVRCKACSHYTKPYCSRFMVGLTPADDDAFCAWGERKEAE